MKKEPMVFCSSIKWNIYKKDCLDIQCPFRAFWNKLDIGGYSCQYYEVKQQEVIVREQVKREKTS